MEYIYAYYIKRNCPTRNVSWNKKFQLNVQQKIEFDQNVCRSLNFNKNVWKGRFEYIIENVNICRSFAISFLNSLDCLMFITFPIICFMFSEPKKKISFLSFFKMKWFPRKNGDFLWYIFFLYFQQNLVDSFSVWIFELNFPLNVSIMLFPHCSNNIKQFSPLFCAF